MLTLDITLDEFIISIVDGICMETRLHGVVTHDSEQRNRAYDLLHEKYTMQQKFERGFWRYYALTLRESEIKE